MTGYVPVAVVGGGPCGLLTALLLARAGVEVELFEQNSGISTHPKAMGITRRTAEIYRQLGLLDQFVAASLPLDGRSLQIWSRSLVGEEFGRIPLSGVVSEFSPCSPLHCPQTVTEQILFEALSREPRAKVHFGAAVGDVRLSAEGGELVLADGKTRVFEWLVAADGAGSSLRKRLEVGTAGPGDMGHFLNVMFRAPYGAQLGDRRALLYSTVWEEGFEAFVAIDGEQLWLMHHFLQPGETAADFDAGRLAGLIRQASGLPDVPVEIIGVNPWVMSPKLAALFRAGRVFLVGDAAARLSPAGGLGLNTGMQSAHNLAWKLAAVVHAKAGVELLDSYHTERHGVSATLMRATNQNAGEVFAIVAEATNGHWDSVRQLVAHSRRAGTGLGLDLGLACEQGAFVADGAESPGVVDPVNDYVPCAKPGCRAPHLALDAGSKFPSLLDFFGHGFVLLVGRDGEGWKANAEAVEIRRNGADFSCPTFEKTYGIGAAGAVLVRPDGIVGARWNAMPQRPLQAVAGALNAILRSRPA